MLYGWSRFETQQLGTESRRGTNKQHQKFKSLDSRANNRSRSSTNSNNGRSVKNQIRRRGLCAAVVVENWILSWTDGQESIFLHSRTRNHRHPAVEKSFRKSHTSEENACPSVSVNSSGLCHRALSEWTTDTTSQLCPARTSDERTEYFVIHSLSVHAWVRHSGTCS